MPWLFYWYGLLNVTVRKQGIVNKSTKNLILDEFMRLIEKAGIHPGFKQRQRNKFYGKLLGILSEHRFL